MKLKAFNELVTRCGIERDPRKDKSAITSYSDSGILYGKPGHNVRSILVGIDIEVPELLLADRFREKRGLDLVIAHHPEGRPFAELYGVMDLQIDVLRKAGMAEDTARQLMEERSNDVERGLLAQNHTRSVDAARLLDMPFLCMHTPADNHVWWYIQKRLDALKPTSSQQIIDFLMSHEEYRDARDSGAGPKILLGNSRFGAGRVLVDMTGGTEGHHDVFGRLYKAGIRTMVCMHLSEQHFRKAKDTRLNVIIAGHISSDSLGMNLLLDNIERKSGEMFDVIGCSGFKRVRRGATPSFH